MVPRAGKPQGTGSMAGKPCACAHDPAVLLQLGSTVDCQDLADSHGVVVRMLFLERDFATCMWAACESRMTAADALPKRLQAFIYRLEGLERGILASGAAMFGCLTAHRAQPGGQKGRYGGSHAIVTIVLCGPVCLFPAPMLAWQDRHGGDSQTHVRPRTEETTGPVMTRSHERGAGTPPGEG